MLANAWYIYSVSSEMRTEYPKTTDNESPRIAPQSYSTFCFTPFLGTLALCFLPRLFPGAKNERTENPKGCVNVCVWTGLSSRLWRTSLSSLSQVSVNTFCSCGWHIRQHLVPCALCLQYCLLSFPLFLIIWAVCFTVTRLSWLICYLGSWSTQVLLSLRLNHVVKKINWESV